MNIPVSDQVLGLLARNCGQLRRLTLLASNVSDGALASVFEACCHFHSVKLCGSPYFGSRDIQGSFLGALFKRSKALTNVSLDCMHNVTASKLCCMLLTYSQHGGGPRKTSDGASHTRAPAWARRTTGERSTIDSLEDVLLGSEGSGMFASQIESLTVPDAAAPAGDHPAQADATAALARHASLDPPAVIPTPWPFMHTICLSGSTNVARVSRGAGERWWADVVSSDECSSAGCGAAYAAARHSSTSGQHTHCPDAHWIPTELPPSLLAPAEALEVDAHPHGPAHTTAPAAPRYSEASASSWGFSVNGSCVYMHAPVLPNGERLLQSLTTLALDHMPKLREGGPGSLCALLAHAPHLLSLSLQGYDGAIDCVLEAAVHACPDLTSVGVGGCLRLSDHGLLQLCELGPQLNALSMPSCVLVTYQAIQKVLSYHQSTLESVDLWGTRACGPETAALLTSGRLRRVNIGGTFLGDSAQQGELLRRVMSDIPAASSTEVSSIAQSALLSHRVMFAPRFHDVLAMSSLVDV